MGLAASAGVELAESDRPSTWAAAAWLASPLLLVPPASRAVYALPLVAWVVVAALGTDAVRRSSFEDLWLFNVLFFALLQTVVLWGLRRLAPRELEDR